MSWKQIIYTDRWSASAAVIRVLALSLIITLLIWTLHLRSRIPIGSRSWEPSEQLSEADLHTISIDRSDVGYVRKAGDFILRIAYHEAVHAGQMLQYLRMAGVERPSVWD